ncbi:MAG TPA: hypothetical protein PK037_02930 [Saprospiraceae bacterium]|nr:hypothetical protein [Saprospiraceae bacterium]
MMRAIGFILGLILNYSFCIAQAADTMQSPVVFSGVITATNNGISLLPNFSLNKPAVLFDLSVSKNRVSFDPMLRFGINGKPWSFIFWWRYKAISTPKFSLSCGAHPSFLFRSEVTNPSNPANETLVAQRYFAWEIAPQFYINPHISAGLYYLGSHGLSPNLIQYTHFLALRSSISNISLGGGIKFTLMPQVYYLKMDRLTGNYMTISLAIIKSNFPLTLSTTLNKAIKTDLTGTDFVWNVGVNYNFKLKYIRH